MPKAKFPKERSYEKTYHKGWTKSEFDALPVCGECPFWDRDDMSAAGFAHCLIPESKEYANATFDRWDICTYVFDNFD